VPQKGWKTVTIREDTLERLTKVFETRERELEKRGIETIDDLVNFALDNFDAKELHGYLEHFNLYEDHVTIVDNQFERPKYVNVYLREGKLYCEADKIDNCIHVGFALNIPEVRRKLGKLWK
jgi:hypothetical protein